MASNELLEDNKDDNAGVSSVKVDLSYVPFEEAAKPKEVDKRIFLPLYATTAAVILFRGFLPTALLAILVTIWAFVFLATPLYYLYNYHPDSVDCCQDNSTDYESPKISGRTASV